MSQGKFDSELILKEMELLRRSSGAFIAAPGEDYFAMWLRDHLYMSLAYYYLGQNDKLIEGLHIVFDVFLKHRHKFEKITYSENMMSGFVHTKYHPENLDEMAGDWGHHQLDAIGLFLHIVADLDFKNIKVIRNQNDRELIQLIVFYLLNVQYWQKPDLGMWEECYVRHSSSIGAVVGGLSYIERRHLAVVPDELISKGRDELFRILPDECSCNESMECWGRGHSHHVDMAQLALIWPYNIIPREMADLVISRIEENQDSHLVGKYGLKRYHGDVYYRMENNLIAEWPMGFFWFSIVHSQRRENEKAREWFNRGCEQIIDNRIPELFQNGSPNKHTPLGWAHALALIAFAKLEDKNPA